MHLFLDSDGVFADFDQHVFDLFGNYPRDIPQTVLWSRISETKNFWNDMPLMPHAVDFWNDVKHFNPTILTGCPKTDYYWAADRKKHWWKTHFNYDDVITCFSKNKPDYMKNKGDILIDDFIVNIKRWKKAGGNPIYFKTHAQAIDELTTILNVNS